MEFVLPNEIYLRANKTATFLAEITSGVTVAKKTYAIQAWKKPSGKGTDSATGTTYENTMTFNEELDLDIDPTKSLPLEKSKLIIPNCKNEQAILHMR